MKKAFDANVSRTKPRMRLGALGDSATVTDSVEERVVEEIAERIAREPATFSPPPSATEAESGDSSPEVSNDLQAVLKAKSAARVHRPSAAEALRDALQTPAMGVASPTTDVVDTHTESSGPTRHIESAVRSMLTTELETPHAHAAAPEEVIEVQTPAPPPDDGAAQLERRERLKERLRAVRENPRPEPLPDTVAEAGVLAVERISSIQTELAKARALNLALTQDLEAARRQAERATEEARLRMDEARRLSSEMESRVALLGELERELASLEGERNEALLALQESRQILENNEADRLSLTQKLLEKDREVSECLAEEERLASDLEAAQDSVAGLVRSTEVLKTERDQLARQVADLTRERTDLLEARKALEAVHRALSAAVLK